MSVTRGYDGVVHRILRPVLVALLVPCAIGVAGFVAAPAAAGDATEVRGPPMTAIAQGPLGRAALVVIGRVKAVRGDHAVQVATLEVERVVRGQRPDGDFTVIAGGPRPTTDRQRPSVPYLREGDDRRLVFFLSRAPQGVALRLDTLFEAEGMIGEEKTRSLIEHAHLMSIADPDARAEATLAWLLEAQKASGTWTRVHAARELNFLARVWPSVFDAAARKAIDDAARRTRVATQRTWLCRALKSLSCLPKDLEQETRVRPELRVLYAALEEAEDEAARLAAYVRELERPRGAGIQAVLDAAGAEDVALQVSIVESLVLRPRRDTVHGLRARYSRVSDPEIHAAMVKAMGFLGSDADVDWLIARLGNGRIRRDTMFALARIRTPEAVAALEGIRAGGANSAGAGDIVPLAEYLLSAAFVEVERAEGRAVGSARGR